MYLKCIEQKRLRGTKLVVFKNKLHHLVKVEWYVFNIVFLTNLTNLPNLAKKGTFYTKYLNLS